MEIKFINHACFQIFDKNLNILIDPWFFGKVFNNSWSLIEETNLSDLQLSDLTHILISHEHPDHFHIPTLIKLKEYIKDSKAVKIVFPKRTNPNVANKIKELGYSVSEIEINLEKMYLDENSFVQYFSEYSGGDQTICLDINGYKIVNMNDHYPTKEILEKIKMHFKKPDLLFNQFSLAGYYGNREEPTVIKSNGTDFHIRRFIEAVDELNPIYTIPFASFVYFSNKFNAYLNQYVVRLQQIENCCSAKTKLMFVKPMDDIYPYPDTETISRRNKENILRFDEAVDKVLAMDFSDTSNSADPNEVVNKIIKRLNNESFKNRYLGSIRTLPNRIFGLKVLVKFHDQPNTGIKIDFLKPQNTELIRIEGNQKVDVSIPSADIAFMFDWPWGADTVNIMGTASVFTNSGKNLFGMLAKMYQK